MPPQRVGVLRHFDLKTGVDLAYLYLESRRKKSRELRECMTSDLSFQFQMNKKERIIYEFEVDCKKSFTWRSNLSNDKIISLKRV